GDLRLGGGEARVVDPDDSLAPAERLEPAYDQHAGVGAVVAQGAVAALRPGELGVGERLAGGAGHGDDPALGAVVCLDEELALKAVGRLAPDAGLPGVAKPGGDLRRRAQPAVDLRIGPAGRRRDEADPLLGHVEHPLP